MCTVCRYNGSTGRPIGPKLQLEFEFLSMPAKRRKTSKQKPRSPRKKPTNSKSVKTLSRRKKFGFAVVTLIAFCGMVELALFFAGVTPLLGNTDPYVGFSNQVPLLTERLVGEQTIVETAQNKLSFFNYQTFTKNKQPDTYRIFCLGGSTTYGRPYDDRTSFCGWLRELLPAATTAREWEVINAGGISYASYRVVRVMEELAEYDPDLFIVYTGHNEFLEERSYRELRKTPGFVRELGGLVARTRTYSALHRMLRSDQVNDAVNDDNQSQLEAEVHTQLDHGIGPDAYQRDVELAKSVVDHFDFNLNRMIDISQAAGATIVFVTPASNLADCSPFKSEFADGFAKHTDWQRAYDDSKAAFAENRFQDALNAIEFAVTLAPSHAATHFLHGKTLSSLGRFDQAKKAFTLARENDICPLRALTAITRTVRDVCRARNVAMIDFETKIDELSGHSLPGESLFLDHVHPTVDGHRILAIELLGWLETKRIVQCPADWNERLANVTSSVKSKIDRRAQGNAILNLSKVLAWAGKQEEANRLAIQADNLLQDDAETIYLAGNALLQKRDVAGAIKKFEQALDINPKFVLALNSLGSAYSQTSRLDEALSCFEEVVQLKPDFAPAHNNLGTVYQTRTEYTLAMQHYNEAIRLNPRYSKAYNNAAVVLREQQQLDKAETYLQKALAINPEFAEANFNLGKTHELRQDFAAAASAYKQAIRLDARFLQAFLSLGKLYEKQRNWPAAGGTYQQAMSAPTNSIEAARCFAWLISTCPDPRFRDAKMALQLAKDCAKATRYEDSEILSTLAAAHAEARDTASAIKWQTLALEKAKPKDRPTHQSRLNRIESGLPLR